MLLMAGLGSQGLLFMHIEIIGAESLGVRGLCCFVKTRDRNILIDPGIALGYVRHKLLPHTFSGPVPHGEAHGTLETVIMTRIEEDEIFVHAPDIQLLDDDTVSKIIRWNPDIVFAGGPPIYLSRLSEDQTRRAWHNAERLCQAIDQVILDHHLMRSHEGLKCTSLDYCLKPIANVYIKECLSRMGGMKTMQWAKLRRMIS